jgi:tripartite-type tricarboxylate transporter receptor subunit TctC
MEAIQRRVELIGSVFKRLIVAGLCVFSAVVSAQSNYPSKPVRIFVGFNPGGPTDIAVRILAEKLGERFKQAFVVENRTGANGAIAAQAMIAAAADGYTLLFGTSGALTISPLVQKNMGYQPLKDLAPIGLVAGYPYILVVSPDLPVNDVKSLVEYTKSHPRTVSFASSGIGSYNHFAGEWLKSLTGADIVHVPYKGDAPALADLVSGRVQMGFNTVSTAMPQVKVGKLKALAVTSAKPTNLAPGLPTMIELGYKDFVVEPWNGLFGPAALPKEIIDTLNKALSEILSDPAVQAKMTDSAQSYVLISTPEGLRRKMEEQSEHWRRVADSAGVRPE